MSIIRTIILICIDAFLVVGIVITIKAFLIKKRWPFAPSRSILLLFVINLFLIIISFFMHLWVGPAYTNKGYLFIIMLVAISSVFVNINKIR